MARKFKVGDKIAPIYDTWGVREGVVTKIIGNNYHIKIMNGKLILPFSGEVNYKLIDSKQ
jgi:hypothetical protein